MKHPATDHDDGSQEAPTREALGEYLRIAVPDEGENTIALWARQMWTFVQQAISLRAVWCEQEDTVNQWRRASRRALPSAAGNSCYLSTRP